MKEYLENFVKMDEYYCGKTDVMPDVLADCDYEERNNLFKEFLHWRALFDVVQNEKTVVNAIFPEGVQYVPKLNEGFMFAGDEPAYERRKGIAIYTFDDYFPLLEEKKIYDESIELFNTATEKLKTLGATIPDELKEPPRLPKITIDGKKFSLSFVFWFIDMCERLNEHSEEVKEFAAQYNSQSE